MLISGFTVMVAMAGLFLTGDATFASFGYATIIVVAVAMLGSLTVLPALLSKLGDRVYRLRLPLVDRRRGGVREGDGAWAGSSTPCWADRSSLLARRRPLVLAVPALQLHMATPGPDTFPQNCRRWFQTFDRMQASRYLGTHYLPTSSSRRRM